MDPSTYQNPQLPLPDQWIVDQLLARSVGDDITPQPFLEKRHGGDDSGYVSEESDDKGHSTYLHDENHFPHSDLIKREDQTYNRRRRAALRTQVSDTADEEKTHHDADVSTIFRMEALNDTESPVFVPTVFTSLDLHGIENRIPAEVFDYLVTPYVLLTQSLARNPADAVFVTHLILYFTTLVPSAVYLFYNFTWTHAFMHLAFQTSLTGTYKAMMHHHVRDRGVLQPFMEWLDLRFSYILDPLTGFTWNARYLEHIRQQSIKSTAPEDTSRYERDNVLHLTEYTLRFTLLNWFSLSRDFYRTTQYSNAVIAFLSELGTLAFVAQATSFRPLAGLFVLVLPLILTRMIFAIETWGRRAFVDTSEPQSEFKNSITLIDVQVCPLLTFYPPSPY